MGRKDHYTDVPLRPWIVRPVEGQTRSYTTRSRAMAYAAMFSTARVVGRHRGVLVDVSNYGRDEVEHWAEEYGETWRGQHVGDSRRIVDAEEVP